MSRIRTRFAPSPTGFLHLGNIWVAFANWLWTRQRGGQIVLRIEDIDRQRSKKEFISAAAEDLEWLGLDYDEGPGLSHAYGSAIQSERGDFYNDILHALQKAGRLYPCYCTRARLRGIASAPHPGETAPPYDGRCRNLTEAERARQTKTPSRRFRMEEETVSFTDLLGGRKERTLRAGADDFVLLRADGMLAYQLAAPADDGAMGITHVFRGNDLLESTFGQIVILKTLGFPVPTYAHLPLLVDKDGIRLSKRQKGITIRDLRAAGKTPADIIGRLLHYAGANEKNIPVTAEEALRNISFEDLKNLHRKEIRVE